MYINYNELKEELKKPAYLYKYMQSKHPDRDLTKSTFRCLNPAHEDKHPSMALHDNYVKCFACNVKYDLFALIGVDYALNDFMSQLKKAYEIFEYDLPANLIAQKGNDKPVEGTKTPVKPLQQISKTSTSKGPNDGLSESKRSNKANKRQNYTGYYDECNNRLLSASTKKAHDAKSYLINERGISEETIKKYKIGFDPNATLSSDKGKEFYVKDALVFPVTLSSYEVRSLDEDNPIRYAKQGTASVFNQDVLKTSNEPVFVTEGVFDALSIEQCSTSDYTFNAISLGSATNQGHLINYLQDPDNRPRKPLVLALDGDKAGINASKKLAKKLDNLGVKYVNTIANPEKNRDALFRPEFDGVKDANEYYNKNKSLFISQLAFYAIEANEMFEAEIEPYIQQNSVAGSIQGFIEDIKAKANRDSILTGFKLIDKKLGEGLFEGLYIMGALSSLGKTTLMLQIADNIAEQGDYDVLFFSLEMSKYELMAKSVSRLTYIGVLNKGISQSYAKTTRGISEGRRYGGYVDAEGKEHPAYDDTQKELIADATAYYSKIATNLYIYEGLGNIGVREIKEAVDKHYRATGKAPIVFIDYLQILQPYDMKATDKQNTDIAVRELKKLSREYSIPVFAISSFNRQNYHNIVNMTSFKESGAIEYSSDVLIGLQFRGAGTKDFNLSEAQDAFPREIEFKILKNRNGEANTTVNLEFYQLFNYFKESFYQFDEDIRDDEAEVVKNTVKDKAERQLRLVEIERAQRRKEKKEQAEKEKKKNKKK